MSFDPFERVPLGRSGVPVTRLALGGAPIGGLYTEVREEAAVALVRHAWDMGIRYFDVAPLYGYGNTERRVGIGLLDKPRDAFVVSSKVGRLIVPYDQVPPGADIDRQASDGKEDAWFVGTPRVKVVYDYSYDGVMRSVEGSLARMGLDHIDILLIHDADSHWEAAIGGAFPALAHLREQGLVRAIGAGMNQTEMLVRFAREGDFDAFLIAGRYTLLDQAALPDLMPLCIEKGIGVIIGGVMNSGLLADPSPGSRFNYVPTDRVWLDRALRLAAVCDRHAVPLKAAAVQFVLAHPAVATAVAGVRTFDHLDEYPAFMRRPIPNALWDELRAEGLLPEEAPTPGRGVPKQATT